MSWLEGRAAVVTGAGRGIGRATGFAVAARGARVTLAARDGTALEEAAEEIRATGGTVEAFVCDVGDAEQVDALFDHAERALGPVTALVCGAGVLIKGGVADLTGEEWDRTIATNLTGAFLCCRRAFRSMRMPAAGEGRIVAISSLSGVYGTEKFPGLTAYNASKAGLVGLVEGIAVDGREFGVSAACLSPGAVDTEMLRMANPALRAGLTPDGVAAVIITVLEDLLPAASGANIPLFSNR